MYIFSVKQTSVTIDDLELKQEEESIKGRKPEGSFFFFFKSLISFFKDQLLSVSYGREKKFLIAESF